MFCNRESVRRNLPNWRYVHIFHFYFRYWPASHAWLRYVFPHRLIANMYLATKEIKFLRSNVHRTVWFCDVVEIDPTLRANHQMESEMKYFFAADSRKRRLVTFTEIVWFNSKSSYVFDNSSEHQQPDRHGSRCQDKIKGMKKEKNVMRKCNRLSNKVFHFNSKKTGLSLLVRLQNLDTSGEKKICEKRKMSHL